MRRPSRNSATRARERRRERLIGVGGGVEAVDGLLDGGEDAGVAGGDGDAALLPGGEVGADGVFLDHGGEGGGGVGGGAEEGGDGVVVLDADARGARGRRRCGGSRRGCRSGASRWGAASSKSSTGMRRPDLRIELAELAQGVGVEAGAVARQGGVVDLGEGDEVDGGGHGLLRFGLGRRMHRVGWALRVGGMRRTRGARASQGAAARPTGAGPWGPVRRRGRRGGGRGCRRARACMAATMKSMNRRLFGSCRRLCG